MHRLLGIIVVLMLLLRVNSPVEAADSSLRMRSIAPPAWNPSISRSCTPADLLGTWRLVKYASPYRFKDPRAAYLLPHQLFQFSPDGGMKSAHSALPITEQPDLVFSRIPRAISYAVEPDSLVTVQAPEAGGAKETWQCVAIVRDASLQEPRLKMKRGDVVLTLVGKQGQPIFVRLLRKAPA